MNRDGWLRLTKNNYKVVYVWAPDVAMIEETDDGTLIHVTNHGNVTVSESPDFILNELERADSFLETRGNARDR